MSIGHIAFGKRRVDRLTGGAGAEGFRKKGKLLLMIPAGLLLGAAIGILLKWLLDPEPFLRWITVGGVLFFGAEAGFITAFSRAERKHGLMLAGYEEKQRFYYGLLDSLFAAMEDFEETDGESAAEMVIYLRDYRTEFYTYADGKVIDAVNSWLKLAEKLAGDESDGVAARGLSALQKKGEGIINAVKEDMCQKAVADTGEGIFPGFALPPEPLLRRLK